MFGIPRDCVEMDPEEDRWYDYESPPCRYNHGFSYYSVPDTPRAVAYQQKMVKNTGFTHIA